MIRRRIFQVLVTAAGLLLAGAALASGGAGAASAAPLITGYHAQSAYGCGHASCSDVAWIGFNTTNDSSSHVWINGTVAHTQSGGAVVTWAGVGGGNGTAHLQVGANFTSSNGVQYYYRELINSVGGSQWCSITGNAPITFIPKCYA